jgi:hypothetical protein
MMRPRRASVIAAMSLLAWAATAGAEGAQAAPTAPSLFARPHTSGQPIPDSSQRQL